MQSLRAQHRDRVEQAGVHADGPVAAPPDAGLRGPVAVTAGIDGALLTWPDFVDGVTKFGERVKPLLREAAQAPAA